MRERWKERGREGDEWREEESGGIWSKNPGVAEERESGFENASDGRWEEVRGRERERGTG